MTLDAPTPAGLLLIDKAIGYTSMDVCAIIRTRLRRAGAPKRIKVGHAGTLDPMATGLLVVLVGKATRLCDRYMADEKVYECTIDLAHRSTTDDAEGQLTPVEIARPPTREEIERAAAAFVGVIQQRPPDFSALHVGGRRAYDLARQGQPLDLPARPVVVHEFAILDVSFPLVHARVRCGKGTYIRSLARDLGAALGVGTPGGTSGGGMLRALRRTRCGEFDVGAARTLEHLPEQLMQADLRPLESPTDGRATT